MQSKQYGNEYRTTLVCVDSFAGSVLAGRMYNPAIPGGHRFISLMDFLIQMEALLDGMCFPQSFTAARSFSPVDPSPPLTAEEEGQRGQCATFALRMLFRQNASWQGSVKWLEAGREESFRSALELFLLMESAISAPGKTP
ncbi:MAG: hypothetical protein RR035_03145 [Oscillibacter sp.]